jgi:23S rRNA pseudouridine2604 synthase
MSDYPMRINKYLATKGIATRREADTLIEAKRVFIGGRLATLGDKVMEKDLVEVRGKNEKALTRAYYAYHKPRKVVTHSARDTEEDISMLIKKDPAVKGVFPVGRLDKDSSGLIILTNDGRITDRLLSPRYDHEKEYIVRTARPLRKSFKEYMEKGVRIENDQTKPTKIRILGERSFAITLTEGKRHQIRRMVVAMHNEVMNLQRIRVMNITLGKLPSGGMRKIEGKELQVFLRSLGL